MSEIHVRPALPAEYEAVGELTVGAYTAGGHADDEPGYATSLRDVVGRAASADVLVAVDGAT